AGSHPAGPSTPGSHPDGLSGRPAPGPAAFAAAQPSSSPSPRGRPGPGAERSSKNPGPPAGATPQPRPAASRSARPAPLPLPAAPRPAPSAPRSGQTVPHTTAAPDTAPPNQTMITNRAPAPTHHRSTGGLTGYAQRCGLPTTPYSRRNGSGFSPAHRRLPERIIGTLHRELSGRL